MADFEAEPQGKALLASRLAQIIYKYIKKMYEKNFSNTLILLKYASQRELLVLKSLDCFLSLPQV
jgi:hypothetical protein